MTLDWVIVGGGIHGVHIAACLLGGGGLDPERVRIVDPGPRLLSRWRSCSEAAGMSYMRSSVMHHLDTQPYSLLRFASQRYEGRQGLFIPAERPPRPSALRRAQ